MSLTNEEVGQNLKKVRGDLSQQKLADAMREEGFPWSQTTVWMVESGSRPLRLTEAAAIRRILGVPVDALMHGREISDQEWAWRAGVATGTLLRIRAQIDRFMEEMDGKERSNEEDSSSSSDVSPDAGGVR